MDMEDRPVRKDQPIKALEGEDLDSYSLDDLVERIERLRAEIARTERVRASKGASQAAAEALFGKS
ncbi:hypothetical protein JCM17844_22740 [Iodidimonas gelatinilytica]|uniref:DUF1192 domain-containing protein n=1 Tax=Iodidimonas gelatinilytica TaxID=1236966 RepID=A0A5A7MRR2_9PROT|nr:DUF1192 domain-containing protein [Iodidimonas gelatinilytica]GEQ98637.1 hypothetical protein JCM17844_22740 [Iodidimonas gelatinilytica]GER01836.1 hypothetical protein JCM17845_24590 [Iodidimonas gelatinilytica]